MLLEVWRNFGVSRPYLQSTGQVVVSVFSFSGMLANNRDGIPAIVSGHRSGFVGNRDQWLFFFAAILFFVPVGSRHGCNVFGQDSLD